MKWRVVASYGQFLISSPGCRPFKWGGKWAFVHHKTDCKAVTCGRRADTLAEALQFVDVELMLERINAPIEVSA